MEIKDLDGEIWKDISEFEGLYMISNYGRVKSIARDLIKETGITSHINDRIKKTGTTPDGLENVTLSKNKATKTYTIKVLVARHFVPNPLNHRYINNKDENKLNCRADNLEWCTFMYYIYYGTRNGRKRIWNAVIQMKLDGSFVAEHESISHAHRTLTSQGQLGLHISEISRCCNGILEKHGGYKWKWKNEKNDRNGHESKRE